MTDTRASALGEWIRAQREMQDLSMRQMANLAGISNPYLSQIERGLRAPSEQVLEAIASALRTSADSLREEAGVAKETDDGPSAVVDAINSDPRLSAAQRRAMLEIYDAFTA
ncbi:MAG: helix-turn-helix transcriptional regulator [Actinobacteria bacterium]|nr:helix-turn-helix transcriptional regulator [Actinomycetota bacterium]